MQSQVVVSTHNSFRRRLASGYRSYLCQHGLLLTSKPRWITLSAGSLKECWTLAVCWDSVVTCGGLIDFNPSQTDAKLKTVALVDAAEAVFLNVSAIYGIALDSVAFLVLSNIPCGKKPPLSSYTATGSRRSLVALPPLDLTVG